jgi:2'-5' RNA ligase
MYAVVSLLDEQHYALTEALWRELESECGLTGIALRPLPHFSWHIAAEYDFKQLEAILARMAAGAAPFSVRTTGLGLFTGDAPVIYIQLIKEANLAGFHQALWEQVHPTAIGPSSHYAPEVWVPHITLAYGFENPGELNCAVEKLAFQPFNWEIRVDHLALVCQESGQVGKLQSKFLFGRTPD